MQQLVGFQTRYFKSSILGKMGLLVLIILAACIDTSNAAAINTTIVCSPPLISDPDQGCILSKNNSELVKEPAGFDPESSFLNETQTESVGPWEIDEVGIMNITVNGSNLTEFVFFSVGTIGCDPPYVLDEVRGCIKPDDRGIEA